MARRQSSALRSAISRRSKGSSVWSSVHSTPSSSIRRVLDIIQAAGECPLVSFGNRRAGDPARFVSLMEGAPAQGALRAEAPSAPALARFHQP